MSTGTFSNISVNILENNDTTTFPRAMLTINGNSVPVQATKVNTVNPNQKGIYVKCNNFYYFIPEYTASLVLTDSYYKMSDVYPSTYTSMATVPDVLDTNNVTNMQQMFSDCSSLTTIPQLNTSNVTNMSNMFSGCDNITTIPQLDTSNVTGMGRMF